jgi:biopolymer transport protein ExbD
MSMEMSRRAKRMEKHHRRRKNTPALNIVALMDIFTILVFFLLVNQSGLQPQGAKITLPKSTVEKVPKDTLIVTVNNEEIFVQGRKVADVMQTMADEGLLIPGLQQELMYQANKSKVSAAGEPREAKPVTIMGDREIPYKLLKKIMLTCSQTGFSEVSLAVTRTAGKGAGS